jgi:hypothetical protein
MINKFYDLDYEIGFEIQTDSDSGFRVEIDCRGVQFMVYVFESFEQYETLRFDSGLMMHRGIGNPSYGYAIYRGLSYTFMESYSHGLFNSLGEALDMASDNLSEYINSSYFYNWGVSVGAFHDARESL